MNNDFKKPNRSLGVFLVLFAGIFWSTSGVVYRLIELANSWQVLFYRSLSLFFMIFFWLLIKYRLDFLKFVTYSLKLNLIGGFCLGTAFTGYIHALENTSVANAMFILAIAPFVTALLGILVLGEKILWYMWICMFFTAIGLSTMVGEQISLGRGIGELSALIAALGFSGMTVSIRANNKNDLFPTIFFGSLFATLFSGAVIIFKGDLFILKRSDLIYSCAMGLFQLGLGVILYTMGAKHLISVELTLLSLTEVIVGPLLVWFFFEETPTRMGLLGGLIILLSIIIMSMMGLNLSKKFKKL